MKCLKCNQKFLINKKLIKTNFKLSITNTKLSFFKWVGVCIVGCAIGFINGFWGGGGGMLCVPALTSILKLPDKIAHATTIFIMLPISLASFLVYFINSQIEWGNTLWVSAGFMLGGFLGALLLKKANNNCLRIVFSLVIIYGGIRLLI